MCAGAGKGLHGGERFKTRSLRQIQTKAWILRGFSFIEVMFGSEKDLLLERWMKTWTGVEKVIGTFCFRIAMTSGVSLAYPGCLVLQTARAQLNYMVGIFVCRFTRAHIFSFLFFF